MCWLLFNPKAQVSTKDETRTIKNRSLSATNSFAPQRVLITDGKGTRSTSVFSLALCVYSHSMSLTKPQVTGNHAGRAFRLSTDTNPVLYCSVPSLPLHHICQAGVSLIVFLTGLSVSMAPGGKCSTRSHARAHTCAAGLRHRMPQAAHTLTPISHIMLKSNPTSFPGVGRREVVGRLCLRAGKKGNTREVWSCPYSGITASSFASRQH